MYTRKTMDQWIIQCNYGQGWEEVDTATTRKEARECYKCYVDNQHGQLGTRLIMKRVKIA